MKQRVCIAMAIALNPPVIIADEPTSALDVVVQQVVAQTLLDVKQRLGVSMLMIGHDMGLQAQMVNRLAVMYAGNLVEIGGVESIFEQPLHPYTQLRNPPPGCIFQYRCPIAREACRVERPTLVEVALDHFVSCINYQTARAA
jgi:peptide/nickel transport system ATP-binding protein